jgi:hypothetical protein
VVINLQFEGDDTGTAERVCLDGIEESDLEDVSEEPGSTK